MTASRSDDTEVDSSPVDDEMAAVNAAADSSNDRLGRDVRRGLGWSFAGTFALRAGSFVTNIALARLIAPEEFGIFAVAIAVNTVLVNINDLGLIYGLVRWQGDTTRVVPTAVALAGITSATIYSVTFLLAPAFSSALGSPEAANLLRVLSLVVLVDAVSAGSAAMLIRDFRQKVRALAQIGGMAAYAAIAVTMAANGFGAWSLAWGQVAGNTLTSIVLVLVIRPPMPRLDWEVARGLLAFGLPMAGSGLIAQVLINVDYVVIATALSSAQLGYYLLAFNMANWPVQFVSAAIRPVSIAGFSKLRSRRDELERVRRTSLLNLTKVALPASVLIAVLSEPVIALVYGTRWLPAAEVLRFLAILGGLRVVTGLMGDMILAEARSRTVLLIRIAWLVALVPALYAGVHLAGLRGAGMAHAVVAVVVVVPTHLVALQRCGVALRPLAFGVLRPLGGAAVCGALAFGTSTGIESPFLAVAAGGTSGATSYALLVVSRDEVRSLVRLVGRRAARIRRAVPPIDTASG